MLQLAQKNINKSRIWLKGKNIFWIHYFSEENLENHWNPTQHNNITATHHNNTTSQKHTITTHITTTHDSNTSQHQNNTTSCRHTAEMRCNNRRITGCTRDAQPCVCVCASLCVCVSVCVCWRDVGKFSPRVWGKTKITLIFELFIPPEVYGPYGALLLRGWCVCVCACASVCVCVCLSVCNREEETRDQMLLICLTYESYSTSTWVSTPLPGGRVV